MFRFFINMIKIYLLFSCIYIQKRLVAKIDWKRKKEIEKFQNICKFKFWLRNNVKRTVPSCMIVYNLFVCRILRLSNQKHGTIHLEIQYRQTCMCTYHHSLIKTWANRFTLLQMNTLEKARFYFYLLWYIYMNLWD